MTLNCAEFCSKEPTEEMIADLVRSNAKRGKFMKPLMAIALLASDRKARIEAERKSDAADGEGENDE